MIDKKKLEKRLHPKFAIPVAVLAVSFAAIFIRLSNAHPISIAFYRMFFSTLILLLFVPNYMDEIKSLKKKDWLVLLSAGIFLAVHFASWISSLNYTSVASSVVLVTAHPLVVSWISGWHLDEKTSKRAYLAIIVALFGVFVMTYSDYSVTPTALFGDLLAIIGMFAVAAYIIRGREMRKGMSVVPYSFIVYGFSTIFLAIFSIGFSTSFKIYPPREYLLFIALALIPTMFGHTLYNWALKYVRAKVVSISLLGEPIGSSILAFFILSEVPPYLTIIGAAITLFGIYLSVKYD
ncbi:MAG: DMT family transporter [Thermoplasmatota archaeon]